MNHSFRKTDFDFLLEAANLVIAARRSLSFAYPYRFYLIGENKQRYFDFIQGDLESSLEELTKLSEQNWTPFIEEDPIDFGTFIQGPKFMKYKKDLTNLQEATTKRLNGLMADIEAGLPDIKKEKETTTREIMFKSIAKDYYNENDWKCKTCLTENEAGDKKCYVCGARLALP